MKEDKIYFSKNLYAVKLGKLVRDGGFYKVLDKGIITITEHLISKIEEGYYTDIFTQRKYAHGNAVFDFDYRMEHYGDYFVIRVEPIDQYLTVKKDTLSLDELREILERIVGPEDKRPKEEILSYIYLANQKLKKADISDEERNDFALRLQSLASRYIEEIKNYKRLRSQDNNAYISENSIRIDFMKKIFALEEEIDSFLTMDDRFLDKELEELNKDISLNLRKL